MVPVGPFACRVAVELGRTTENCLLGVSARITRTEHSEQRPVWNLRLTVVTTAVVVVSVWGSGRFGRVSSTNWLFVIAGLTIVLLALSKVRLVAAINDDDLAVRVLGIRLLDVRLDTVSSVTAVGWPQLPGFPRWVLDEVMPPGGVQITTETGRRHFVASNEPGKLAELIRTHL